MTTYEFKLGSDLALGDWVCGVETSPVPWAKTYEIVTKYPSVTSYTSFTLKIVESPVPDLGDLVPWEALNQLKFRVKVTVLKYDPTQAGDRDDDV